MSNKALYRKYRPTTLRDVVGQNQITHTLQNAIDQGNIRHAYLFIGPRGTGKTSVARIFAHAVNQFDYQVEDNYLDIIEIDAASNTGVDNIRELREKAVIAPSKGKYKVYIIDEVHMLTKSASNALLKTLEEPPEHVIFIMATTDAHKVPITISSRTQVFTFRLADADTMLQHLKHIAAQEKIAIDDDALRLIVQRGGGSFRDSLSLLDQAMNLSDGKITAHLISDALGLPQSQALDQLLDGYARQDGQLIHDTLRELINNGIKPEIIASELISLIIDRPQTNFLPLLRQLPDVQPPFPEAKLLLALLGNGNNLTSAPISSPATVQAKATASEVAPSRATSAEVASSAAKSVRSKSTSTDTAASAKSVASTSVTPPPTQDEAQIDAPENTPEAPTEATEISATSNSDASTSAADFDWDNFVDTIHEENLAIYQQLQKSSHKIIDHTLHIYPTQKFTKTILEKPNNTQIIMRHLGDLALTIHDIDDCPQPKDSVLSQISAIMGDVREVNEDLPF